MKKISKFIFNDQQRKETAKILLGMCQVILLAIIAGPYISPIAKKLTFWDTIVGSILVLTMYITAMRLLKEVK